MSRFVKSCVNVALLIFVFSRSAPAFAETLPSLDEALASHQDLWGLAAMRQTNGPSYEFFEHLLPPLRYVNAAFHYYPIVLSAPNSQQKARLLSNGGSLNPHAELKSWKEKGVPVNFLVGAKRQPFGNEIKNVNGPRYEEGWLPIVQMDYQDGGNHYHEETFVSVDSALSEHGLVFIRFKSQSNDGKITAQIKSPTPLKSSGQTLVTTNGSILVCFDKNWKWDEATQTLTSSTSHESILAIASTPLPPTAKTSFTLSTKLYDQQRSECIAVWRHFFDKGMHLDIPEPVVNNAWRSLLIGNSMMVKGNDPDYSWGNAYERLYEAESGDAARAFLLWNVADVRRMVPPLLDYTNDKLKFHNAGFKLQLLAHYYWITRDADYIKSLRDRWQKYVTVITDEREPESGLAPRENYCGDIFTQIYSLNSNAAGWCGLRDIAAVLDDMGEHAEAKKLADIAADYRKKILVAVDKSERRDVQPPFIPIALFGEEKPYDTLTATMIGSYWNLMAPYVIGSGIFGHGSEREKAILDYLQEHGGIFMGMIRFDQHSGLFANQNAVDDLYGLRYVNTLLQRDEPDRALVSFYGKLAQGMTRDTFIGGEGSGLKPLDEFGRPMYLPPNSSANAHFLWTLRYMLVQDWDTNDDGKPDTLRLLFATPRRWLEDGKTIRIKHAPTAFGELSLIVKSRLMHGEVIAELQPPERQVPESAYLRIRLPEGWIINSAEIVKSTQKFPITSLTVDEKGTVKLPALKDKFTVRFHVSKMSH